MSVRIIVILVMLASVMHTSLAVDTRPEKLAKSVGDVRSAERETSPHAAGSSTLPRNVDMAADAAVQGPASVPGHMEESGTGRSTVREETKQVLLHVLDHASAPERPVTPTGDDTPPHLVLDLPEEVMEDSPLDLSDVDVEEILDLLEGVGSSARPVIETEATDAAEREQDSESVAVEAVLETDHVAVETEEDTVVIPGVLETDGIAAATAPDIDVDVGGLARKEDMERTQEKSIERTIEKPESDAATASTAAEVAENAAEEELDDGYEILTAVELQPNVDVADPGPVADVQAERELRTPKEEPNTEEPKESVNDVDEEAIPPNPVNSSEEMFQENVTETADALTLVATMVAVGQVNNCQQNPDQADGDQAAEPPRRSRARRLLNAIWRGARRLARAITPCRNARTASQD